jgi:hypothetical protein
LGVKSEILQIAGLLCQEHDLEIFVVGTSSQSNKLDVTRILGEVSRHDEFDIDCAIIWNIYFKELASLPFK